MHGTFLNQRILSFTVRFFLLAGVLVTISQASEPMAKAVSSQYEEYVLTHPLTPCGPVPTALDPDGVYPYVSYCETANRPVLQKHTFCCWTFSGVDNLAGGASWSGGICSLGTCSWESLGDTG